jgi:hypothetical protein
VGVALTDPCVQWHRVRHESVGGSSTFVSVFGIRNSVMVHPNTTAIRRTIQHVLDFGVRPGYVNGPHGCPVGTLTTGDWI